MSRRGPLTAWCKNPECGEEFTTTETSNDEFCSWGCEDDYSAALQREQYALDYSLARCRCKCGPHLGGNHTNPS